MLTPAERSLKSRIADHSLHAQRDPRETTSKARATFLAKFEELADPDSVLSPAERARRAHHLKQAYFARLALKSARTRRRKAGGNGAGS